MEILLINGSPRKDGHTAAALSVVERRFKEHGFKTNLFQIGNQPVRGCISCGGCRGTNRCVFEDDGCVRLTEEILAADGIVVGSPVYFAGPNGALCALLDRVFYSTCTRSQLFHGKPGAALVTCEWTGGTAALDRLHRYFVPCQMPVIGSLDYPVITKKAIENQEPHAIRILETLADNMAGLLKK